LGGHNNAAELGDTWEWDGVNWVQRSPATVPPARHAHAMAYDSARGVTVLFGGYDGSAYRNDTWEWDGVNWVQRSPATVPPARVIHAMAYDSARGVTVLFGGHPVYLDDTWEWNGVNWLQRAPATVPPGRESHAMAYDSAHGVTVLFGGKDGNGQRDDTWVWDGTDWELRTPSPTPPARMGHAMSYDSAHGVTVLFGGSYEDPISHYLDDTWEYGWLILSPPVLLAISNPDGDGEYLVDWNEVTGAATYQLQEDDNSAFTSPTERYYGTNSHYDVSGQQGGTWYYRVRASNPLGDSPWSGIQAVTVRWRVHLPLVLRGVP
jgi:hypothetical protein